MKVPILIAYLKKAEKDASFLYKVLPITTKESADSIAAHEIFTKHAPVVAGESYTTNDLLTRMVQYSDNTALNALVDNIDQDSLIEVASDVDIRIPENASVGASDFLTAKSYSYLFRLLYNSTYLRKDLSEKALSMLADTDFTEGLRANIPDTVAIAHKFGERTFIAPDGKTIGRELHDCGIVYYPGHPYLLCIMSKGSDFIALSQAVQDISAHIYTAMQKDYN
jgi:beta-lactamase class A